ncbi:MOSC domain-containing protein [Pararhizobium haloflavum]|uniref:MOSC domain-containing protein n=1 Tax=Pararhizobium haloflavum TaxID=2037914 RepID=UPI000C17AE21|nr:molybdenum cofactor sulfurase [Pararhizobium haloflavum]
MSQTTFLDTVTDIVPGRRLKAKVGSLFAAVGTDFISSRVDRLTLTLAGIEGDFHAGISRRSGGREPWYPRGTEMRNERQVSIVSSEELAGVALDMDIDRVRAEWIGANIDLVGVPALSMLPPRTLLFFENGVTLKVDGQNAPCRLSGSAIADQYPERDHTTLALSFKDGAKRRRGLVAWVEKAGTIKAGETVKVQIPEQWVYRG